MEQQNRFTVRAKYLLSWILCLFLTHQYIVVIIICKYFTFIVFIFLKTLDCEPIVFLEFLVCSPVNMF